MPGSILPISYKPATKVRIEQTGLSLRFPLLAPFYVDRRNPGIFQLTWGITSYRRLCWVLLASIE
jgi:hypothetical protein